MFKYYFITITALLLQTHIAVAQVRTFRTFVSTVIDLMLSIIPVVLAMAFVVFLWQGAKLVLTASNDKTESKTALFWSVIALFIMVTLWGIVQLLKVTFLPA